MPYPVFPDPYRVPSVWGTPSHEPRAVLPLPTFTSCGTPWPIPPPTANENTPVTDAYWHIEFGWPDP